MLEDFTRYTASMGSSKSIQVFRSDCIIYIRTSCRLSNEFQIFGKTFSLKSITIQTKRFCWYPKHQTHSRTKRARLRQAYNSPQLALLLNAICRRMKSLPLLRLRSGRISEQPIPTTSIVAVVLSVFTWNICCLLY